MPSSKFQDIPNNDQLQRHQSPNAIININSPRNRAYPSQIPKNIQ